MFTDMGRLKVFLNILDVFFLSWWGFTTIEMIPFLMAHGFNFGTLNQLVAFLFSLAGLVFLIVKVYFFIEHSALDSKLKKETIRGEELDNNEKVRDNYISLFKNDIDNLSEEEKQKSAERLK